MQMWANCTAEAFERNKTRMLALSTFSREAMHELQARLDLSFDYQERGTLQVFRTPEQVQAAQQDLRILQDAGVNARAVPVDELLALEPGLARSQVGLAGGLHLPDDATGDCHRFTQGLARAATAAGVKFFYGTEVTELWRNDAGAVVGVITPQSWFSADVVVLAMGSDTPRLAKQAGLSLPVYPIKGYSLTYDVTDARFAPSSTLMDETYKVAITRLGNRVRVGGTAEVCGFDHQLRPERRAVLTKSVTDLFPEAGNPDKALFWTGLRPGTPDSVPYLGFTSVKGLWVNCGHGTLGWTMACGGGKALAALISGDDRNVPTEVVKPLL
jgi:D-amino-acid dehydrogenase